MKTLHLILLMVWAAALGNRTADPMVSKRPFANEPPVLTATGNPFYCPGVQNRIVSNLTITDPDDTATHAIFIQISSGYISGTDMLSLVGSHPGISATWDAASGKLKLSNPIGTPVSYMDFESAVEDVVYTNTATNPNGVRNFSITVGQANYLPSTGHYYEFVPSLGITWSDAKMAAETSTYYGLQGYLATIMAQDEAQLSGEQSAGAGWIGGSDAQTEGTWKWVTGPENGIIFWQNNATPNFANWNTYEPNDSGSGEDYAHITAPGVGIAGSWNDLPNTGEPSGDYQPKGYIVEYGGMPGDPVLQISASTTMSVPSVIATAGQSLCGAGSGTLTATVLYGTARWFDSAQGGNLVYTGSSFTTPVLTETTTYYVDPYVSDCPNAVRTPVSMQITQIPLVNAEIPAPSCDPIVLLHAQTTAGTIRWHDAATGGNVLGTGDTFTTPELTGNTIYYVDAENQGCYSASRLQVNVVIYQKPVVTDQTIKICPGGSAVLDADIDHVTYAWSEGNQTTKKITVTGAGVYTVAVTSPTPESCTSVKTFTVTEWELPVISQIEHHGLEVTIHTAHSGEFEYSVDGIHYQSSNVLFVDLPGTHTAYVRELHGCGAVQKDFFILDIPQFFTPNGDNWNDRWGLRGMWYYPEAKMTVFDRHGKLICQLSPDNPTWDGTLQGHPLPADDYWYVLKMDAISAEVRGHFSLLR